MDKDGGLRTLFRLKIPDFQWTSIEYSGTSTGIPDSEYCAPNGVSGWIEYKFTKIYHVSLRPFQVAWIDRRARMGGNAYVAVRRKPTSKKENGNDELWLIEGNQVIKLMDQGLQNVYAIKWIGGPSNWNWSEIGSILCKNKSMCYNTPCQSQPDTPTKE